MTEQAQEARKRAQSGRSPSYPGIPLSEAIDRGNVIYKMEKRNTAPVTLIMKHWGYNNPTSGRASVTFAALKKFGLITEEGTGPDRVARLTDRMIEIVHNPDPLPAIRAAALAPPIHRELWDEYRGQGLPSDESLKWTLQRERGFTPSGAAEFVKQFRETLAFANLDPATDGAPAEEDAELHDGADEELEEPRRARQQRQPRRRPSGDALAIPVPIIGGEAIIVEGHFPVTEAAWSQFLAVLNAMKPGLVQAEPAGDDDA